MFTCGLFSLINVLGVLVFAIVRDIVFGLICSCVFPLFVVNDWWFGFLGGYFAWLA